MLEAVGRALDEMKLNIPDYGDDVDHNGHQLLATLLPKSKLLLQPRTMTFCIQGSLASERGEREFVCVPR